MSVISSRCLLICFFLPQLIAKSPIVVSYPSNIFTHPWDWRNSIPHSSPQLLKDESYLQISKAQDREDIWMYENWFYGMTNGTILESGALNGVQFSTSSMFEKFASWLAIHVEADPKNYHELRQYRPNSVNVHVALCKEPKILHFTNSQNNAVNGFVEFMTPLFLSKWHPQLHTNPELIHSLPTILCVPLPQLLAELGIHKIDIWVLDVEGAELQILQSMDFKKITVHTIAMECDKSSAEYDQAKRDILIANDFTCQQIERNCFCHHSSFKPSVAPPNKVHWKELRLRDGAKFD